MPPFLVSMTRCFVKYYLFVYFICWSLASAEKEPNEEQPKLELSAKTTVSFNCSRQLLKLCLSKSMDISFILYSATNLFN